MTRIPVWGPRLGTGLWLALGSIACGEECLNPNQDGSCSEVEPIGTADTATDCPDDIGEPNNRRDSSVPLVLDTELTLGSDRDWWRLILEPDTYARFIATSDEIDSLQFEIANANQPLAPATPVILAENWTDDQVELEVRITGLDPDQCIRYTYELRSHVCLEPEVDEPNDILSSAPIIDVDAMYLGVLSQDDLDLLRLPAVPAGQALVVDVNLFRNTAATLEDAALPTRLIDAKGTTLVEATLGAKQQSLRWENVGTEEAFVAFEISMEAGQSPFRRCHARYDVAARLESLN
ncbi:MAG: hypothetical protein AAGA48_24865 [Myxococcota bacterium]